MSRKSWKRLKGLVFEKELLPVGDHVKWVGDNKEVVTVRVRPQFLARMRAQFKKFKEAGVRVPLFKTHKEDPDNDRGTVKGVVIKRNDEGKLSSFVRVQFHDREAAKRGVRCDVSAMCPPKFVDSKRNVYNYPLRHVALTSKPVVAGLQPFEPVVMSFDTESGLMLSDEPGEMTMKRKKWHQLLRLLGADPSKGDDAALEQAIARAKKAKLTEEEDELEDDELEDEEEDELEDEEEDELDEEDDEAPAKREKVALSYPPLLVKEMQRSRETRIDALTTGDNPAITPAVAKELKKQYANKRSILVDLSLSEGEDTEFDRALTLATKIAKDRPWRSSGRSTIRWSHGDEKEKNPLIKDAEARAAKVKKA